MLNIFIIHGTYGHPQENWFPWLKAELEKLGHTVFVPKFPTPENQTLENWLKVFSEYKQHLDSDSIVVGHSLGVPFLLSVLESINIQIKGAFLISGFLNELGNQEFDELNRTFVNKSLNWQKIRQNCKHISIFHSDNDPYVPIEQAEEVAKNFGVEVTIVKGAGHFNEKAGYTKFELLLEKIKELVD